MRFHRKLTWSFWLFLFCSSVYICGVEGRLEERDPIVTTEEYVEVFCELKNQEDGEFKIIIVPEWAPKGAERFLSLVEDGFFDGTALFRAVENFLVQFGISKNADLNSKWAGSRLLDDPKVGVRIQRGTLAFAGGGKNSRTTQLFIAFTNTGWPRLGREPWETPFGYVHPDDIGILDKIFTMYGDMPPWGNGPNPGKINAEGYSYLEENYPQISYLTYCKIANQPTTEEDPSNRHHPSDSEISKNLEPGPGQSLSYTISTFAILGFIFVALLAVVLQFRKKNE
mmetsp:Transcript_11785/g.13578  ORF Transcript_11785/g.13578 Transcript_11785/m.13578 type:complete len:283 (-) Transcript_11785:49-897(-)